MVSGPGRVTLATVAEAAGVSAATVSKVINGRRDVSDATRARILELLRQHDYGGHREDLRAHPTVELFFGTGELSAYSARIIEGVVYAGAREGVAVVISARRRHDPAASPREWAHQLDAAGRRAVVAVANRLTEEHIEALNRVRMPLVAVDSLSLPRSLPTVTVGSTNFAGGQSAAKHLLGLGHRRIAYLGGYADADNNRARFHGVRGALEDARVPLPREWAQHAADFSFEQGVEVGGRLLDLPERPGAVIAANDALAAGVIEAARQRRLRVPDDISIVGFDDTEFAQQTSPPLTTVRQALQEMGAVALRTALRLAAGEDADAPHVELATQLVVRASTRPAAT